MAGTSYVPGTWLGILRGRTAVLLGPETPPALAGAVWDLLGSGPEVHEVLHAVTSSSGGSLTQIPSFGILDFTGPLRVFLRGDLDLSVELPDGRVELDGRDVTTWNERRFALPEACRLAVPAAGSAAQPELPLGEGVVLLQSVALVLGSNQPELAPAAPAMAAVVVDSAGVADVPDAVQGADGHGDVTIAPEHGASAETVLGMPDDDGQFDGSGQFGGRQFGDGGQFGEEAEIEEVREADPETGFGLAAESAAPASPAVESAAPASLPEEPLPAEPRSAEPLPVESLPAESLPAESTLVASDLTSSYDHLWERTVVRSIEDAAVRDDGGPDDAEHDGTEPDGTEPDTAEPGDAQVDDAGTDDADAGTSGTPAAALPAAAAPEAEEPRALPALLSAGGNASPTTTAVPAAPTSGPTRSSMPAPAGGLIVSVPWKKSAGAPAAPEPAPGPVSASVPGEVPVPVAVPASPAESAPAESAPSEDSAVDNDHDGQTIMRGSIAASAGQPAPAVAEDPSAGPTVLARVCSQGHANPPTRSQCATCGAALLPDAVQVARPRLGRVRMSTGELLDLDQSLVVGRQPSVSRVQGGIMPRLVQVPSPGGDISRSHVEVRLEGWHVMLCDLKATNGTVLVREGQPPRRLAQNEMAILLDGDIAELGDNISLRFEEIP